MREPRQRVSLGYAKAAFALAKIFLENLTDARELDRIVLRSIECIPRRELAREGIPDSVQAAALPRKESIGIDDPSNSDVPLQHPYTCRNCIHNCELHGTITAALSVVSACPSLNKPMWAVCRPIRSDSWNNARARCLRELSSERKCPRDGDVAPPSDVGRRRHVTFLTRDA